MRRSSKFPLAVILSMAVLLGLIAVAPGFLADLGVSARIAQTGRISVQQPDTKPWNGPVPTSGYDISYPQCQSAPLPGDSGFAIIGVNGGRPGTEQPCLEQQLEWARTQRAMAVYVNTEYLGKGSPAGVGVRTAKDAIARMREAGIPAQMPVWLDVETENEWRGDHEQHRELVQALARKLAASGHPVGLYSAPRLWARITGSADPGMPVWLAIGRGTRAQALEACAGPGLGGRQPAIVQWVQPGPGGHLVDHNVLCSSLDPEGMLWPNASAAGPAAS